MKTNHICLVESAFVHERRLARHVGPSVFFFNEDGSASGLNMYFPRNALLMKPDACFEQGYALY